jgi:serine/threonine protein kinase
MNSSTNKEDDDTMGSSSLESTSRRDDRGRSILLIQMEFCNMTLSKFLMQRNRQCSRYTDIDRVTNIIIALQIVNGLTYLHSKQVVHRDIKPNNIFIDFLDPSGQPVSYHTHCKAQWESLDDLRASIRVKLGDLGLAKKDGVPETQPNEFFVRTEEHTIGVGSPIYSSPEQLQGRTCSSAGDVFSAGIVLAELCFAPHTVSERQKLLLNAREGLFEAEAERVLGEELGIAKAMVASRAQDRPSLAEVKKRLRALLKVLGDN